MQNPERIRPTSAETRARRAVAFAPTTERRVSARVDGSVLHRRDNLAAPRQPLGPNPSARDDGNPTLRSIEACAGIACVLIVALTDWPLRLVLVLAEALR